MKASRGAPMLVVLLAVFLIFSSPAFCAESRKPEAVLAEGTAAFESGEYAKARALFLEALAAFRRAGDERGIAGATFSLSLLCLEELRYDDARGYAEEAIKHFDDLRLVDDLFSARTALVSALYGRDRKDAAWELLGDLEKAPIKSLKAGALIPFYLQRGRMLAVREQWDTAGKNFDEAARLALSIGDGDSLILADCHRARLHASMRDFARAREICWKGLERARASRRPVLVGLLLEADGEVRSEEGSYREASLSLQAALAQYRSLGNDGRAGSVLLRIAHIYDKLRENDPSVGDYLDKAVAAALEAGRLYEAWGDGFGILRSFIIFGSFISDLDEPQLDGYCQRLTKYAKEGRPPLDRARALMLLAEGLVRKRDLNGALASLTEAEALCRREAEALSPGGGEAPRKGEGGVGETIRCLIQKAGLLSDRMRRYQDGMSALDEALALRDTFGETVEGDDRFFFGECSPGAILRNKATYLRRQSFYEESLDVFAQALDRDSGEARRYDRVVDLIFLIQGTGEVYDFPRANRFIAQALAEIPKLDNPLLRATAYGSIATGMQIISRHSGHMEIGMFRGANTLEHHLHPFSTWQNDPAKTFIDKLLQDPGLVKAVLDSTREWARYEHERGNILRESIAYIIQGYVLTSAGSVPASKEAFDTGCALMERFPVREWKGCFHLITALQLLRAGRSLEAESHLVRAADLLAYGSDRTLQSISCELLGVMKREARAYEEALLYFEKAQSLVKDYPYPFLQHSFPTQKGYTYYQMKRYSEAAACFAEAARALGPKTQSMEMALTLAFLAMTSEALGKEEAITQYEEALSMMTAMSAGPFERRDIILPLGALLEKRGDGARALALYLSVIDGIVEMRSRLYSQGAEERFVGESANVALFERTIKLLIASGRYDSALEYLGMSHSLELMNSLDLESVKTFDPGFKTLLDRYRELKTRLELLGKDLASSAGGQDAKRREYISNVLARTRSEFFSVINEIRSKDPDFEQLISVRGPDLAAVQKVLPVDTLLLEYYPSKDDLLIFVIDKTSFSIRSVTVSRERLFDLVREFRKAITEQAPDLNDPARALYGLLIAPVSTEIDKHKDVLIIPGGLLWYLPFEALLDEDGTALVERRPVSCLTSAHIPALIRQRESRPREGSFVAFGDPDGAALPSARSEVESLRGLFPGGKFFLGKEATKERFLAEAPVASRLHIASHSSLNRVDINDSYILFSGPEGKLRLGDIYGLSLDNLSLVVLSSCESALGEDRPGCEIASLASAFTTAGAPSVIASLWKVEDASTGELFKEFYEALSEGESRSGALRRAKIHLLSRKATSHPFYWAGFSLYGDWK
jgi:CHAT domain-containing protein